MPAIIHPPHPSPAPAEPVRSFRQPHYECTDLARALLLVVRVPGVEAAGIELTTRGPDLVITARRARLMLVNCAPLRPESAQRDYQLKLRLGLGFDFRSLQANLDDGALAILLPKRPAVALRRLATQRQRVA